MTEELKNAFSRFLENGGTKEEFWAWRREALADAEARRKRYAEDVADNNRERIEHLMELGYTRLEAEDQIRLEAYEAHDAMGGNPRKRIGRTPPAKYAVGGMAI